MAEFRYLEVSPRGFLNEKVILRVPLEKVEEAKREFAGFEDYADGGYHNWLSKDQMRNLYWTAVDWDDRAHVGLLLCRDD
jgi:hypothetical protein